MTSPISMSGYAPNYYWPQAAAQQPQRQRLYPLPPEAFMGQDSFESLATPGKQTRFSGGAYGMSNVAVQQYIPIMEKRNLAPQEVNQVQQGQSRWLPKLFAGYGTPLHQLMASPGKVAILHALVGGVLGAVVGLGRRKGLLFGALAAGAAALFGYFTQQQRNDNVLDLMQRLPAHATKRDLLSDPAYQADLNRQAMYGNTNGWQTGLMGAQILASALNSRER